MGERATVTAVVRSDFGEVAAVMAARPEGRVLLLANRLNRADARRATAVVLQRARAEEVAVVLGQEIGALAEVFLPGALLSGDRQDLLTELVASVREIRDSTRDRRWQSNALVALLLVNTALLVGIILIVLRLTARP